MTAKAARGRITLGDYVGFLKMRQTVLMEEPGSLTAVFVLFTKQIFNQALDVPLDRVSCRSVPLVLGHVVPRVSLDAVAVAGRLQPIARITVAASTSGCAIAEDF